MAYRLGDNPALEAKIREALALPPTPGVVPPLSPLAEPLATPPSGLPGAEVRSPQPSYGMTLSPEIYKAEGGVVREHQKTGLDQLRDLLAGTQQAVLGTDVDTMANVRNWGPADYLAALMVVPPGAFTGRARMRADTPTEVARRTVPVPGNEEVPQPETPKAAGQAEVGRVMTPAEARGRGVDFGEADAPPSDMQQEILRRALEATGQTGRAPLGFFTPGGVPPWGSLLPDKPVAVAGTPAEKKAHETLESALTNYGPGGLGVAAAGGLSGARWKAATPERFVAARDKSTRPGFLSTSTPDELRGSKLFLSKDGKAGAALTGVDIANVFNNGGPKGAGIDAIVHAIDRGGRTLDAYHGYLTELYRQLGFVETGRMKFNPEFAHNWDPSRGKPDVVFMAWKGYPGGRDAAIARAKGAKDLAEKPSTNYYDNWDAGKAASLQEAVP